MRKKINLSILLATLIFIQGCALNEYQQVKINDNSYLVTFDSSIPKSLQNKIDSILKLKTGNEQGKNIQIYVSMIYIQATR